MNDFVDLKLLVLNVIVFFKRFVIVREVLDAFYSIAIIFLSYPMFEKSYTVRET